MTNLKDANGYGFPDESCLCFPQGPSLLCDGANEEAGLGRELVQPASLSPRRPSASGSGAQHCSSLDRRVHFMLTEHVTSVRTTIVKSSKHLQYHCTTTRCQDLIPVVKHGKHKVLAVALALKSSDAIHPRVFVSRPQRKIF